ncbi:hypothetical protein MUK42_34144 [Musa troglodytarum]|uniref:Uncharacterized protein n=1 Tax=Musa troglodytarum TaxID=320322 RepID=A0A9E7J9Y8_9LILI|nr:hypothetical protein MUK42_34144 [Musa troglodytarum]
MSTKLGLALIVVLVLVVLFLVLELVYVSWYRRRFQRATSVEDAGLVGVDRNPIGAQHASKEIILHLLCYMNQTRVEPAVSLSPPSAVSLEADPSVPPKPSAAEVEMVERDAETWQATPPALLYAIGEEDRRGATGSSRRRSFEFATPCASPPFYTPVASPSHDAVEDDRRTVAPPMAL